jgi:hypothetical protein
VDTQETNCLSSKTDTEERKEVKSGDESMAEHDRGRGKVPSSRDDYVSHHLLNSRSKTNRDPKAACQGPWLKVRLLMLHTFKVAPG